MPTQVEERKKETLLNLLPLEVPTGRELQLAEATPQQVEATPSIDPELEKMAEQFTKTVLSFNPNDIDKQDQRQKNIAAVENLGIKTQSEASKKSQILKRSVQDLASKTEDGGPVAQALVDLNVQIDQLDPGNYDLEPGWFGRTLGRLPFIGSPLQKYFTKFQAAETVIAAIVRSLTDGKDTLIRDNLTLVDDQKGMRVMTVKLDKAIQLGRLIDQKLSQALEQEITSDDPRRQYFEEELLFPLRQRIVDLQQQLAVNQQGVIAIELVIRNNKELIKGVGRSVDVTVNALNVAVTVAFALANQKIVLEKVQAVNETTSRLISHTAEQLHSQAAAIQKQAAGTMLNMDDLQQAFTDMKAALNELAEYRRQALPVLAEHILRMDEMTKDAAKSIEKMEEGNRMRPALLLDVD
jgi:uncharacterized protein YaaN involved in tellurite resistance